MVVRPNNSTAIQVDEFAELAVGLFVGKLHYSSFARRFYNMTSLSFSSHAAFAKTQNDALGELLDIQTQTVGFGESLKTLSPDKLNFRPEAKRWSTLECLEHLNRYARHYLPLLEERSSKAASRKKEAYKVGLLGKPFALAMHPSRRSKAVSSPKNMNPFGSKLAPSVVDEFIAYQERYHDVLQSLAGHSLRGSRIPISVVPIVRLHLGDMLHTLVWHNARHCLQAEEALSNLD